LRSKSLCELGCGTGAIICELQRRGVAQEYPAIDYSVDAISYLKERTSGINCIAADITDRSFRIAGVIDVVVLSHVIEHLEDPLSFLRSSALRVSPLHIVVEVPLEDLWFGRFKNLFRDRLVSSTGHVQFYTPSSFRNCLEEGGWRIIDHRRYVPVLSHEIMRFLRKKDNLSGVRSAVKTTGSYLARLTYPVWERAFYAHYAALCKLSSE
jgi:2-polyprenyl-3-methyl-5-hydroxy-6-metoxy-1,4-benzoquinol methylase